MNQLLWIEWAKALQAISQTGLHYAESQYDRDRYEQIAQISTEILANHSNLTERQIVEFNASDFGYATPKVDVRGVIFKDAKILLVREIADQGPRSNCSLGRRPGPRCLAR